MSKLTKEQIADVKQLIIQGVATSKINEKYPNSLDQIKGLKSEWMRQQAIENENARKRQMEQPSRARIARSKAAMEQPKE